MDAKLFDLTLLPMNRSGIMGLAFPGLLDTPGMPFLLNIAQDPGVLSLPLFAFSLDRFNSDPTATEVESNGGTLDIGFTSSDRFSGTINYVSLTSKLFWMVPLAGITLNGNNVDVGVNNSAVIDT